MPKEYDPVAVKELVGTTRELTESVRELLREGRDTHYPAYKLATFLLAEVRESEPELVPAVLKIVRRLRPHRHSEDFASVYWYGESYTFTHYQAAVVQVLWKAWVQRTPDVRHDTLLFAAGSMRDEDNESDVRAKIKDIFRDHPAWGTMIQSRVKGTYRLSTPH